MHEYRYGDLESMYVCRILVHNSPMTVCVLRVEGSPEI